MVFYPPACIPKLPFDPPDSIPIHDFMFDESFGRHSFDRSLPLIADGLSGKEFSAREVRDRVEHLACALAEELGWIPNSGSEWDKVAGLFTLNTVDTLTTSWAVQRLGGISSPANAAFGVDELAYQLKSSGAKVLFTCLPCLPVALEAAGKVNIPRNRIYLLDMPKEFLGGQEAPKEFKTVEQFIQHGQKLKPLDKLRFASGQGARQVAFLCYSSGTSGLPKGVMISHRNVIANVMQSATHEAPEREMLAKKHGSDYRLAVLGLLPYSHIYALVAVCHVSVYRGDKIVCLPKFEINSYLEAIQHHKIAALYVVPPIIILMTKNKNLCEKYDLSSVRTLFTGAAPLGPETIEDVHRTWPHWLIRQAFGMTETCTVATSTPYDDIDFGSSGCLVPSFEAKIMADDGREIKEYDQEGELLLRSPSVVLGYLNNEKATKETFGDGWCKTGDKALVRKTPNGNEHIWIVDRIKELIKVKGLQVAPAELEAHLLSHPAVADVAVIGIPDDMSGEVAKAYVVKSGSVGIEDNERMTIREIKKHVEKHKARHKWLQGGVEFIDEIPKSASGKILRRVLRDKEKNSVQKARSKL